MRALYLGRYARYAGLLVILLTFWAGALTLSGSTPAPHTALLNRQRLDRELRHAQMDLGVPRTLLANIIAQEQAVRNADRNLGENDQVAASDYALLTAGTRRVEQTASVTLRDGAAGEVELLKTALTAARSQHFPYVFDYQARLEQAQQLLDSSHTTREYASVAARLASQLAALRAMGPAYSVFQRLRTELQTLRVAGMPSSWGEAAAAQDALAFQAGVAPQQYRAIIFVMQGQMEQINADLVGSLISNPAATLKQAQHGIDALRAASDPANAAMLQKQRDVTASALISPDAPSARLSQARLSQARLNQAQSFATQVLSMSQPLLRAQAWHDVATLGKLLAAAQRQQLLDPFTGGHYPAAYEYANASVGYPHIVVELRAARSVEAIQAVDEDAIVMSESLRALQADLKDNSPANQPHAADLRLLQQTGLAQGKVIVVSLVEQVIRFYENGRLVNWSYITTGRPELPSPPGIHFAVSKAAPVLFVSPEARTSPLWFEPTPVHYAILYANGNDFIHDAWWRTQFGPGTQLPHYDPIAFNGGSHGCINLPLKAMAWVYTWTPVGAPVLVY